ncbi:MAG: formyltransferase family protein [Haloarculaceae archaeon]
MTPAPLVDASAPLDVALVVSESAARLDYLLTGDGERGRAYELAGAVASHPDGAAATRLRDEGVPTEGIDIEAFYDRRDAPLTDRDVRRAYDGRVADALASFDPDLVVCSGYRFVLTDPVLDRFAPRLVSAHHADLTLRDGDGEPLYPGLRAVRDALRDGRAETRETTHVVTSAVDRGPPLVRSRPFAVHERLVDDALAASADDAFDAYVYAHREWMLRAGGGPTLAKTIELVADGRVELGDGDGEVLVDGDPGPYPMGDGSRSGRPDA